MEKAKKIIVTRISEELYNRLEAQRKRFTMSQSSLIRQGLVKLLEELEYQQEEPK